MLISGNVWTSEEEVCPFADMSIFFAPAGSAETTTHQEVSNMRYSNNSPTSSAAIGNVERQLRQMRREAERIRRRYLHGLLSPEEEEQARQKFRGIFRPLLEDALRG